MDLFSNLAAGLGVATAPVNLLCVLAGCLLGTLAGMLPGVGPAAAVAMLTPLAYVLSPLSALILLAAVSYGAAYGCGSAMLVDRPGDGASGAASDAYQLAR